MPGSLELYQKKAKSYFRPQEYLTIRTYFFHIMKKAEFNRGKIKKIILSDLGWDEYFESSFAPYKNNYIAGRVACRQRTHYEVYIKGGYVRAGISGALKKAGKSPAVGDFAVILYQSETENYTIVNILPRKTEFSRGVSKNEGQNQIIAANVDIVFIVTSAGKDLNPRRLERYLSLVYSSGAKPVIIINKSDLSKSPDELLEKISSVCTDVSILTISALNKTGIKQLDSYLKPGITIALIGSSGVGKSTLINTLLKDYVQETCDVREYDEKGHHKTTVRQMFLLSGGGVVIDNPGLREVGIGTSGEGLSETFSDIKEFSQYCRFSDCRHKNEPGCAVIKAVSDGNISKERLETYLQLKSELRFEQEKSEIGLSRMEKKKWKSINATSRDIENIKKRMREL